MCALGKLAAKFALAWLHIASHVWQVHGELLIVPQGQEVEEFVAAHMEPLNAVAVAAAGEKFARSQLLKDLADNDLLKRLLVIAVHVTEKSGPTSLTVYCQGDAPKVYQGKWAPNQLRAWLQDAAYPLVNRFKNQFAPPKYLTANPYGTVFVVKPVEELTDELVTLLEPYALKYRPKLRFTFLSRLPSFEKFCDDHGIRTNDELLLLEEPQKVPRPASHSHWPPPPRYRLEGVTKASLESFFRRYDARKLPRYYISAPAPAAGSQSPKDAGIRDLLGSEFVEFVNDPVSAVLVLFTSANCSECTSFEPAFKAVARQLLDAQARKTKSPAKSLRLARIDQSANEHSEIIQGTPWLRFWPVGKKKRPVDVNRRSVDSLWDFLHEQLLELEDEL